MLEKAGERDIPLHMTEVNYAEVKCIVIRKDGAASWAEVARNLPTLPLQFHPADRELADVAGDLKCRFGLSLAEAFAAALAKRLKADLVTGDPELKAIEKEIRVQWLT